MLTLTPLLAFLVMLLKKDESPHGMVVGCSKVRDAGDSVGKGFEKGQFATYRTSTRGFIRRHAGIQRSEHRWFKVCMQRNGQIVADGKCGSASAFDRLKQLSDFDVAGTHFLKRVGPGRHLPYIDILVEAACSPGMPSHEEHAWSLPDSQARRRLGWPS